MGAEGAATADFGKATAAAATADGTAIKTTVNIAGHRLETAAIGWFAVPFGAMVAAATAGHEFFINFGKL